jgi:tetratricopeptide (TPR) repeat protein
MFTLFLVTFLFFSLTIEQLNAQSNYRRLTIDSKIFGASPKWITQDNKVIDITLDSKYLKADSVPNKIAVTLLNVKSRESRRVNLTKQADGKHAGRYNFSAFPGTEFYIFFTFKKKGELKTVFFKLASSEQKFKNDVSEVKSANKMLAIIVALRIEMDKKRKAEEADKIKKELEELKRAKAEKAALEKKLEAEMELLKKQKMEADRLLMLKAAEKKRQLFEQRLAEERERKLKAAKARKIAERKRLLAEMKRKRAKEMRQSKMLVAKGQEAIINGEYLEAIKFFKRAKVLNHLNTDADFYTGVSLFYLDKRKEALKILKKIEEENPLYTEVHYYLGSLYFKNKKFGAAVVKFKTSMKLNVKAYDSRFFMAMAYYKMEDYDNARKTFRFMAKREGAKKDIAYLFEGLCYYNMKEYDKAIKIFEKIYYEGEDEDVAEQAEKYLKKARAMKKFEERKAKWVEIDATIGMNKNSNVTATATGTEAPAGGSDGMGTTMDFNIALLPIYNETWDTNITLNYNTLSYSKEQLAGNETVKQGVSGMLKYKSIWYTGRRDDKKAAKYPYSLSVTFDYSQINMDFNADGSKATYTKTSGTTLSLMAIIDDKNIGTLTIPYSQDDNFSDDQLDIRHYGINYSHLYFLNKEIGEYAVGTFSYTLNPAVGEDETYSSMILGGSYSRKTYYDIRANAGLTYNMKSYGTHTEGRSDKVINLSGGITRDLFKDYITGTFSFSYVKNGSSLPAYAYNSMTYGINITGTY